MPFLFTVRQYRWYLSGNVAYSCVPTYLHNGTHFVGTHQGYGYHHRSLVAIPVKQEYSRAYGNSCLPLHERLIGEGNRRVPSRETFQPHDSEHSNRGYREVQAGDASHLTSHHEREHDDQGL
jgi:hypothetical protein